jgi:predicted outer membrane repeat protein
MAEQLYCMQILHWLFDTCSFLNNTGGSSGGAIKTNGKISVTDSTFTENYSGFAGGAVWVSLNDSSFTTFTFDGCTFTSNYANNSYSGAINLEGSTSNNLNIIDTQFTSNYSVSRGGAVYSSGTVTCTGETIFSKNSSTKGRCNLCRWECLLFWNNF